MLYMLPGSISADKNLFAGSFGIRASMALKLLSKSGRSSERCCMMHRSEKSRQQKCTG